MIFLAEFAIILVHITHTHTHLPITIAAIKRTAFAGGLHVGYMDCKI